MQEQAGTNEQLRLSQFIPVTSGSDYSVEIDVGLTGASTTQLRIVARAMGGEVTEVARWQGDVTDGSRIVVDLGALSQSHDRLNLVVQRVGSDRSGVVTVRNTNVIADAP
jgi:hypothetical protein